LILIRDLLAKFALLSVFLSAPVTSKAQDVAALTGIVTDPTDAVVAGVDVTLVNTGTNVGYHVITNSLGSYTIVGVLPGSGYKLTFSLRGFEPLVITDVYLNVATTRTQNARLHAGVISQVVEVSALNQDVTVDTTDATVGNNFEVKLVNDLPVQARSDPSVLFSLQPGIATGAVTGARSDQSSVTLDGLDVNDITFGQNGSDFNIIGHAPVDSVQEFRGIVAGVLPSSGPGGGGQFQLVTKSGTNRFHGNLNEYHRDTSTAANQWFNNNADVGRPPLIRNQFGGNIGGPVLKNKLFFFFDYNNSRIIQSSNANKVVPLDSFRNETVSYILNTDSSGNACGSSSRQNTTPQCIGTLNSAQVRAIDPQGVGFDPSLLAFVNQRYPHANDLTGGDGVNTGGFRFTTPTPDFATNYVGRIDYNLNNSMKLFGRFTISRENAIETPVQFAGDPVTNPFIDRSYAYVIGHAWNIGSNKVNQFSYGDTITKFNFANTFDPTGTTDFAFGGGTTIFLSAPYSSPSSQKRRVPIPVIRDDFSWQNRNHNFQFGGTFKFIKTNSNLVNDFNFPAIGLGGNLLGLDASLRPADIGAAGTTAASTYDNAFAFALGRIGAISSNYDYDNKGNALPQGSGVTRRYRFYQTELYFGDTWKVSPRLTLTYGVRYQLYSVPYETGGDESVQNTSFDKYFAARQAQSAAGISGNDAVPLISYDLGGKANNGPNLYSPSYKDFAPRFSFAYNPSDSRGTVFNGSAGIIYDRTVINAINVIQDQYSYLFQNSVNVQYGSSGATQSLLTDPRLGTNNSFPTPPTTPVIGRPYTPYVNDGAPYGLAYALSNTAIDPTLKDPYSIAFNAGIQQELPSHLVLKVNYVGRLGRRLLAQADASQLLDFPDAASGQLLSNAFANLTNASRAGTIPAAQPWFENQLFPGATDLLAGALGSLINNGDFGDFTQQLAAYGLINANVGMASQFAVNTFVTNKGFSSYNGLLTTLSKNLSRGLQFDVNYTWSHSIDNTSLVANSKASNTGVGFICEVQNPRVCRGNSDFDTTHVITSDFVYDLPVGRGRTFASDTPRWLDEVIGGWGLSGIQGWSSGVAFGTVSNAAVAGVDNNAPAIFNGDRGGVQAHVRRSADGTVNLFADPARAQRDFTGPIGFTIGSRNNLRGPSAFTMDLGLGKTFSVIDDAARLKFRADAFNALNHPIFAAPVGTASPTTGVNDITNGSFGQITNVVTGSSARVVQLALRLEF
jgi:Carboxypeptidase regulatory-like domain